MSEKPSSIAVQSNGAPYVSKDTTESYAPYSRDGRTTSFFALMINGKGNMKLSQTSCQSARQTCRPFAVASRASYAELAHRGADKVPKNKKIPDLRTIKKASSFRISRRATQTGKESSASPKSGC